MLRVLCATAILVLSGLTHARTITAQATPATAPVVVITTAKGTIEIETFPAEAPKSVGRFVELAKSGFYRSCRFHWVQPGVIQMGDQLTRDFTKQDAWGTGGSGPKHSNRPIGIFEMSKRPFVRGIVGLAYRNGYKPETADSQVFILRAPNPALNGKYAAVGRVVRGMGIVDKIELNEMIKDVSVK
jgi:peptidylprolyl isomerase